MKECMIFPRDFDSLTIVKEIEEYLGVAHKNIGGMSNGELDEYINNLVLLLYLK